MNRLLGLLALLLVGCRSAVIYERPPSPPPEPSHEHLFGGHVHDFPDLPLTVTKTDGSRPFTGRVAGVTPVGADDLATKGYVDVFATTDPELAALAATTSAADKLPYFTGAGTATTTDFTAFTRTLLDDTDASAWRTTMGVLGLDPELTSIAGLTSAADKYPYYTGSGTAALGTITTFGRSLVDDTDATAAKTTLGLVIGTNVQAFDAELAAIAGLTSAADRVPYFTGSGTASLGTFTSFGRSLVSQVDAANGRTTLGLGDLSVINSPLPLTNGGTAASLSDPNADRVLFWDDSAGAVTWLTMGTGLTITGTTLDAAATGTNALLDGSNHTDTLAGTVVAGDIIVGNATPKWSRLAKGTAYTQLTMTSSSTIPAWHFEYTPVSSFWKNNPAASGTAVVVPFQGTGGAVVSYFVPVASGTIRGFSWHFSGTHTTGTITIRARKNGSAVTGVVYGPSGATDLSGYAVGNGDTFSAGDTLGVEYDTSGTWNGTAGQLTITLWVFLDG